MDPIHNQAIRICLGAFHTTRIESLYTESNLHSLAYRRSMLGIKYYARALTIAKNQSNCNLFDQRRDHLFKNSKRFASIGTRIRTDTRQLEIIIPPILTQGVPKVPPWIIPKIEVCFDMQNFPKNSVLATEIRSEFYKHKHNTDIDIYTDGSKNNNGVGAGISFHTSCNQILKNGNKTLNRRSSILSAELKAISIGLQVIEKTCNKTCTIYSDSKGSLQTIMQYNPKHPIAQEIQSKISSASVRNNKIIFCWIPSHCGIIGNENADKAAKQASSKITPTLEYVLAKDLYSYFHEQGNKWLQNQWDMQNQNKLHFIDGKIGEKYYPIFDSRLAEIKYNRVRLGHTRFTNKFMPAGEEPPICMICNKQITIKLHRLQIS